MAKVVFPPHGNTIYPWALWMNGEIHRAKRGRKFRISTSGFRNLLTAKARSVGLRVITRVRGEAVTFQFLPK